jgi:hypothetical protein
MQMPSLPTPLKMLQHSIYSHECPIMSHPKSSSAYYLQVSAVNNRQSMSALNAKCIGKLPILRVHRTLVVADGLGWVSTLR